MGAAALLVFALVVLVLWVIMGLALAPVFTLAAVGFVVVFVLLPWYILCVLQGIPWWHWRHITLQRKEGGTYTKIIFLGLVEIRWVPQNYVWVVSFGHSKPERRLGYTVFPEGWWLVWFPKLHAFSLGFVSLRPFNLDLKRMSVNTKTTPVQVDSQVTIRVKDPHMFAVALAEPIEEVVEEILSAVLNYVTADHNAINVVELRSKDLQDMARQATKILNGEQTPRGKPISSLKAYGVEAVVRIQNIFGMDRVMDALAAKEVTILTADAGVEAAKRDVVAARHLGDSIAAIREKADLPPGSVYNLAPMALAGLFGRTNQGRTGFKLPKANLSFDLGGADVEPPELPRSKKGEEQRDREDVDDADAGTSGKEKKGGK